MKYIFLLFLMSILVIGSDTETIFPIMGDAETIVLISGNLENEVYPTNNINLKYSVISTDIDTLSGGGGFSEEKKEVPSIIETVFGNSSVKSTITNVSLTLIVLLFFFTLYKIKKKRRGLN